MSEERARSLEEVLGYVLEHAPHVDSVRSGAPHWKRVAAIGLDLLEEVEDAHPEAVFLFAILHDARYRAGDNHARYGARLAKRLLGDARSGWRAELYFACAEHMRGYTVDPAERPTVAVCWDADRLNVWRVRMCPSPAYLSTEAARGMIWRARRLQDEHFEWAELLRHYRTLSARRKDKRSAPGLAAEVT